ncbi:MAG: GtrA family protein [Patescibacteria group bacterium]
MAIPTNTPVSYRGGKKDYLLGLLAGILIGLLLLPILKNAKPSLYDTVWLFVVPFFAIGVPAGLIVASLIAKRIALVWQLAKFLVIGIMNTLVDIGVLALITILVATDANHASETTWFTIVSLVVTYYSLYKAISFIVANINSFFWNKYWTFGAENRSQATQQFFQFFLVSLIGFAINVSIASVVFGSLSSAGAFTVAQAGLIGAAMGSVIGLAWNFIGYKFFVLKK